MSPTFARRSRTSAVDSTDDPTSDLPGGYDQPDSPYWVEPDLRPHYVADPADLAWWDEPSQFSWRGPDAQHAAVARRVATDDAYWQHLIDRFIVSARNADTRPDRRADRLPWLDKTPKLLATLTDDDRTRAVHLRRLARARAARNAAAATAAHDQLMADTVTGEPSDGTMRKIHLPYATPYGTTVDALTSAAMVDLIQRVASDRYAQTTLPDGRTRAQVAADYLDRLNAGAAPTSRPMIDLSQAD